MSNFDSEHKFWIIVWLVVFIGASLLSLSIGYAIKVNHKHFTDAGYIQVQKVGTTDYIWTKPNIKTEKTSLSNLDIDNSHN